jgi:ribosomal protein L14
MRIPDELWHPALEIARARAAAGVKGETLTAVVVRALRAYIRRHGNLIRTDLDRSEP